MKTYTIEELYGREWQEAIINVGEIIDGDEFNPIGYLGCGGRWVEIEQMCKKLGIRFTDEGEIVK